MEKLDQLLNFRDLTASEKKLSEAIANADDDVTRLQLKALLARAKGLQRDPENAQKLLDEVKVNMGDNPILQTRYYLEQGRLWNSIGKQAEAREFFIKAYEIGQQLADDFYAIDAAHMVSFVDYDHPDLSVEAKQEWNLKALALAEKSSRERSRGWRGSLYNNVGYAYLEAEVYPAALEAFEKALLVYQEQASAYKITLGRYAIAQTLRKMGQVEKAHDIMQELTENDAEDGYFQEELAEILLAMGKADQAQAHFANAYNKLSQDAWVVENESERLERLKTLGKV